MKIIIKELLSPIAFVLLLLLTVFFGCSIKGDIQPIEKYKGHTLINYSFVNRYGSGISLSRSPYNDDICYTVLKTDTTIVNTYVYYIDLKGRVLGSKIK